MKTGAASSSGVFYEAFCGDAAKYEAHLAMYEAALRAMKQSLTASFRHFLGKKMAGRFQKNTPSLKLGFNLKNSEFSERNKLKKHFTRQILIQSLHIKSICNFASKTMIWSNQRGGISKNSTATDSIAKCLISEKDTPSRRRCCFFFCKSIIRAISYLEACKALKVFSEFHIIT